MSLRAGPGCLAVLLVLAGCTGAFSPATETTEDTTTVATANPTAASTGTTTTRDPTTVGTASTTTLRAHTTLDATDLSAPDRDLLGRAVENGSVTVTRSNLTGRLTPDTDGYHVRFDGTLYELSWYHEGLRGEYHLGNATVVNASTVDSSDGVVAYENLTADARELFEAARATEEIEAYGANAFPDQLRSNRYVTYDGEYYELDLAVGDYVVYRLSVTEVDS